MRASFIFFLSILGLSIQSAQAFIKSASNNRGRTKLYLSEHKSIPKAGEIPFRQADIVWKIRPWEELPTIEKIKWSTSTNLLRLDYRRKNMDPPLILCPPGGKMVLETWNKGTKIGRFGITCERGPSFPPIKETVQAVYGLKATGDIGIAAIIYMFVEPEYRGRSIGELALDMIALIHASVGSDFTILVADDKSKEETLVKWYEKHGYVRAPKLQDFMGSPNGQFGISMIAPTRAKLPEDVQIEWW